MFRPKRLRRNLTIVFVSGSVTLLVAGAVTALSGRYGWSGYWTLIPFALFFAILIAGAVFRR